MESNKLVWLALGGLTAVLVGAIALGETSERRQDVRISRAIERGRARLRAKGFDARGPRRTTSLAPRRSYS